MVCCNCKRAIPDGSSACPYCGAHVASGGDPYESNLRNPYGGTDHYRNDPVAAAPGAYQGPASYPRQAAAPGPLMESANARTAQTTGVLGLVLCMLNFTLLPVILCVIGVVNADRADKECGGRYFPSAKVGRVCGTIGLIFSLAKVIIAILAIVAALIFFGGVSGLFEELPEMAEDFFENLMMLMPLIH